MSDYATHPRLDPTANSIPARLTKVHFKGKDLVLWKPAKERHATHGQVDVLIHRRNHEDLMWKRISRNQKTESPSRSAMTGFVRAGISSSKIPDMMQIAIELPHMSA